MNRTLHEPAATQYRELLPSALDSLPRIPRDEADRIIARANAEYGARKAARPAYTEASEAELDAYLDSLPSVADVDHELARLMPITERFFTTGGDDANEHGNLLAAPEEHRGTSQVQPHNADHRNPCVPSADVAVKALARRLPLVALYVAAVVALTLAAMAYGKWAASNGHRALFDWLGGGK